MAKLQHPTPAPALDIPFCDGLMIFNKYVNTSISIRVRREFEGNPKSGDTYRHRYIRTCKQKDGHEVVCRARTRENCCR